MPEKTWFEIKAQTGNSEQAEIWIYDEIGGWGISAKDFIQELNKLNVQAIDLRINSPGGSVYDGHAIYNALKRHKAEVTTYVDGLAASIASVIALAGSKVVMAENALFMIHNPWAMCIGDAGEMRKTADILDKTRDSILTAYMNKTGMDVAEVTALMDAETWYNAAEAKAAGFVDAIEGSADLAACARFDLKALGFRRIPEGFTGAGALQPANKTTVAHSEAKEKEGTMPENKVVAEEGARVKQQPNAEAAEIVRMATAHGYADRAADWIAAGKSVDAVAKEILDMKRTAALPSPAAEHVVALTEKEQRQYSLIRALRLAADAAEGKSVFNCFEKEVSEEISKHLPQNYERKGGFFMPLHIKAAGLDSGTATKGSELKFDVPGEFIDLLRNQSVVVRLGARVLTGLQGPVTFPKQTGAGIATWVSENPGSDVAESNLTLGTVTVAPKTLQSTTSYSRQLLAQAILDIENLVRQDLAAIHALAWDVAAIHGTGNGSQPQGIYNITGVNAVAMGGVPTFGKLVDMQTEVAKDNALFGTLGWVTTPGMAGKMKQTLVASAAGSEMIWAGTFEAGVLVGYGAAASNQVSSTLGAGSNEHGLIYGNFADLLVGQWGALELVVDPYRLKKQGMIEVTSFQMVDIAVRHAESFCKATGATIA